MALVQQALLGQLDQPKATTKQLARKERMAAILRRLKQLYAPVRPVV